TSGSAVIREFALHEVPVRALVRSLTKAYPLASLPNVEFGVGDMRRPDTLARGARVAISERRLTARTQPVRSRRLHSSLARMRSRPLSGGGEGGRSQSQGEHREELPRRRGVRSRRAEPERTRGAETRPTRSAAEGESR